MWEPNLRYPDAAVHALDANFEKYRIRTASIERIAEGCRWCEGPVWFGDGRYLLWSDIPNDRILKWEEESGAVSLFRGSSSRSNGNTRDRVGRLVTCEHLGRRVTRTEYDGGLSVVADRFEGKRLNSPNDVVVKSDGSIWFTDPPFGITNFYEGIITDAELKPAVYRVDGATFEITLMTDEIDGPNGLAFSPDESKLYVVASREKPYRRIRAFDVVDGGRRITRNRILIDAGPGTPDGFRVDVDGNLWCGWGMGAAELDGVRIFNDDGVPIGQIDLPERCANVCFGGRHRNRLFMAAGHSVYSLYVNTQGVLGG